MLTGRPIALALPATPLMLGRPTRAMLVLLIAITVAISTALAVSAVGSDPARPTVVDFHPFYLAGRLALEGHFADSYDVPRMHALLSAFGGRDALIPFDYPPSFGLVLAPLAMLPLGAAFLIFTATTLALYLGVLRRLAGPFFWTVLMTIAPLILVNLRMGQNGLLTGALAGLSAAAILSRRSGLGGCAAGLLAFKPQVAVMLPVLFALRRDWTALAVATATATLLMLLAVLAFGADSIPGFLASTAVLAGLMTDGSLHLNRLTSIYAFASSFGAGPRLALVLHGCALVVTAGVTAAFVLRQARDRDADARCAGLLLMATAFVSPYFSTYDLPISAAGLALVLPDLAEAMSLRRLVTLLIGMSLAGFVGIPLAELGNVIPLTPPSVGGPLLLLCFLTVVGALDRQGRARRLVARHDLPPAC